MSQKPFMWNDNNPVEWSDPSGYCIEDACVGEATAAAVAADAAVGAAAVEGGAELVAGVEEAAGDAAGANAIRGTVSEANGLFAKQIGSLAKEAGDTAGGFARGITGFTRHALNQVISRDGGRGVANSSIVNTIRTATNAVLQQGGTVLKIGGRGGAVVIKAGGKVITAVGKAKAQPTLRY